MAGKGRHGSSVGWDRDEEGEKQESMGGIEEDLALYDAGVPCETIVALKARGKAARHRVACTVVASV